MAGAQQDEGPDMQWRVRLNQVERLDREEGDEGKTFFSVKCEMSISGVSVTLSALATDPVHDETTITEAFDLLLVGLKEFGAAARLRMKPDTAESQVGWSGAPQAANPEPNSGYTSSSSEMT